jgi:predicted unusual protein kinase regulating ubiquinone biosynthesis (AarF/ABC1/UbiB family)
MEKLRDWPRALQAGCFDEWIANADRHHGNILIQGNGNFSLIDHSHAIPIDHQPNTPNRRNTFLCAASPSDKDELGIHRAIKGAKKELSNFVELAQKDWHKLSRPELYCEPEKSKQVVSFLNDRLTILSILIGKKLGDRQQDLYANNG